MKSSAFLCLLVLFQSVWRPGLGDEFNKVEVEVVGLVDCFDCAIKKIFPHEAFSGIGVTVDCKGADEQFKTRGVGLLNGEGKFWVFLPREILLENGNLKEECFVHLHSASAAPCPPLDGIEATRIILKSKIDDKFTFGPAGVLKLSPVSCPSAYFLPHFWHPKLPKIPPWPKFPPLSRHYYALLGYFPQSLKNKHRKPLGPKFPIFKKPFPFPHPVTPPRKPLLPPIPEHELPVHKQLSAATPALQKPFYALPFPKRLYPMSKVLPSRHMPIQRPEARSHP